MPDCTLIIKDEVNVKFEGLDPITRKKFLEALKFMVPHARHTPQFKLKRWDGKIAFGTIGGNTYLNMVDKVLDIIINAGYDIEIDDQRIVHDFQFEPVTDEVLLDRHWPIGHEREGQPIRMRDYQIAAINRYLENRQSIQNISTGAGKTILCACLSMLVERHTQGRTIVIVPSTDLVQQTETDYRNIGLDVGVYYGDKKSEFGSTKHLICTWQSVAVLDKKSKDYDEDFPIDEFLDGVTCVIVDEVHTLTGNVLKNLLCGPMRNIPIRWGMTGTIPKADYEFMSLLSAVGPVVGEVRASTLQEQKVLANCDIEIIEMDDKHVEFPDYESEHKFLTTDPDRIAWMADYCQTLSGSGNTLILVDRVETGLAITELIPGAVFVYGNMKSKKRAEEYRSIQTATNKVIVATYGVAAVGINIPRIFNLVFICCGKSFKRSIQSAGRGLRKAEDKDHVSIKDISSTLKYARKHCNERKTFYTEAGYPHKTTKVKYRAPIKIGV